MLKKRHPELVEGRSLPQRKAKLNNAFLRVQLSPRTIKAANYTSRVILADALVTTGAASAWTKKSFTALNRALRSHIFGFFVISFSALPALTAAAPVNNPAPIVVNKIAFTDSISVSRAPIFQRPVKGSPSQGFWYLHRAIDIPNPYGAPIKPVATGTVVSAVWENDGYGYTVVIKHADGFSSRYAHLSKILVKKGKKVTKGTTIGLIGATGDATGPHLHLELYFDGNNVEPQKYLPRL